MTKRVSLDPRHHGEGGDPWANPLGAHVAGSPFSPLTLTPGEFKRAKKEKEKKRKRGKEEGIHL